MGNKFCCCAKPKEKSCPPGIAPRKCGKSSKHGKSLFGGKRSTTVGAAETISSEVFDGSLNDAVGIEQLFKAHDSTEVNTTYESCESQLIDNDIIDEYVTSAEVEDVDCEVSIDVVNLDRESECQQKDDAQSVAESVSATVEKTEHDSPEKNEVQPVISQKIDVQAVVEINVSERQAEIASLEISEAHPVLHINVATVEKTIFASHEECDVQSDTDIEAVATRETSSACQQNDVLSVLDINEDDAASQKKNCVETDTAEKVANMLDVERDQHSAEEASSETRTEAKCLTSNDTQAGNVEDHSEVLGVAVEKEIALNRAQDEDTKMYSSEISSTIRSLEMMTTGSQNAKHTTEVFLTDFRNPEAGNKEEGKSSQDAFEPRGGKPQNGGQFEKKCLDTNTTDKVIVGRKEGGKTVVSDKAQVDELVVDESQTSDSKVDVSGCGNGWHTNAQIVDGRHTSNKSVKGEQNDKTAGKSKLLKIPDSSSEKSQRQLIENVIKITGNAPNPSTSAVKPPSSLSILQKEFAILPNLQASKIDDRRTTERTSENEKMRLACLSLMKLLNLPVSKLPSGNLSIRKTESASVMRPMSREARLEQEIDETTSHTTCLSTASTPNLTTAQREAVQEISPTVSPCESRADKTPVLKKVSDYPVPKRVHVSPFKINTFKKRPKHMYAIPAVAKPDVACKEDIRWTQVESSNPQAQLPWICRSPRFDVAFPPLGKRLFKRMGSIATMQKNRVIPQTLTIEILKLEDNRFPGLRVGVLKKGRDKYSFELPKTNLDLDDS